MSYINPLSIKYENNILTGSLYTAGILLPQITFAEIQNDKVSPDRPNIIFI